MSNTFLQTYNHQISSLANDLERYALMGTSDTKLNLREVSTLFMGAINEIKSLQSKVDALSEALKNRKE